MGTGSRRFFAADRNRGRKPCHCKDRRIDIHKVSRGLYADVVREGCVPGEA